VVLLPLLLLLLLEGWLSWHCGRCLAAEWGPDEKDHESDSVSMELELNLGNSGVFTSWQRALSTDLRMGFGGVLTTVVCVNPDCLLVSLTLGGVVVGPLWSAAGARRSPEESPPFMIGPLGWLSLWTPFSLSPFQHV